ncbi:DUF4917 family protein [Variovorax sp. PBL-E5]|uniref:DUF4917 family protein n=1 Tax=Variovorax sp. PBL-E5 TaxID=434014 RepID=UPI0013173822|nr:DUF4917 family protein [Variovorax sp. PBL-E5]VTU29991.1 hypothetical protein E5CHR_02923 [Variovorax sp. PBL-E5]
MDHYENFTDVIDRLNGKRRISLLIGNGFSMAYDPKIFSYNALADFVQKISDPTLATLFNVLKTKNFELIMDQLNSFSNLLEALGADASLQKKVSDAHAKLKVSLLDAVKQLHPEHVFKIPQESIDNCAKFLHLFLDHGGEIFSTNYDLLLYWVLMRGNFDKAVDGFGRELLNPMESAKGDEEKDWSELRWGPNRSNQNIHYIHGALPFFDVRTDIVKEQYNEEGLLLENIGSRLDKGEYPIFVTAGSGNEKLELIRHNSYLSNCYDHLCKVDGSVITYGFGFGQYDEHIIDALNKAAHAEHKTPPKLWSIYIGVFSEGGKNHIERIEKKFHAKVCTFNVKSANPWHP